MRPPFMGTIQPGKADLAHIASLVASHSYRYRDEAQLQEGICQLLAEAGIAAEPEARLSDRDRIDLLAGSIGIEVKVAGNPAEVTRQLRRPPSRQRAAAGHQPGTAPATADRTVRQACPGRVPVGCDRVTTYGTLARRGTEWQITAQPHVMIKLKRLFPRIVQYRTGAVGLKDTPEVARDLEWFTSRFPLQAHDVAAAHLAAQAGRHRATETAVLDILAGQYTVSLGLRDPIRPPRPYQQQAADIVLATSRLLLVQRKAS
jgi:hypothetical protein